MAPDLAGLDFLFPVPTNLTRRSSSGPAIISESDLNRLYNPLIWPGTVYTILSKHFSLLFSLKSENSSSFVGTGSKPNPYPNQNPNSNSNPNPNPNPQHTAFTPSQPISLTRAKAGALCKSGKGRINPVSTVLTQY